MRCYLRSSPKAGRWQRLLMVAVLGTVLLGSASCSSVRDVVDGHSAPPTRGDSSSDSSRQYVFQDDKDWIALTPAKGADQRNDHPIALGEEKLHGLLAGLRAQLDASRSRGVFGDRGGRTVPLFTEATLEEIVTPLHRAFEQADATEDVLLHITQKRPGQHVELLGERVVTTARLFHRGGHLHLIVGTVDGVREDVASTNPQNTPKSGSYRAPASRLAEEFPLGSRESPTEIEAVVQGDALVSGAPSGRDDWLVLDTAVVASRDVERSVDDEVRSADDQQQVPATETEAGRSLEGLDEATLGRLRELRELRREDLISAPVYESMVRELLELGPKDGE